MSTPARLQLIEFSSDPPAPSASKLNLYSKAPDTLVIQNSTGTVTNIGSFGTVTSLSIVTANGVSGSVATSTNTPAISLSLGAITPTSIAATSTVTGSNLSGTNTGDQTITLTGDVTGSGTGSFAATLANTGIIAGSYNSVNVTVNNKGQITSISNGAGSGSITSIAASVPTLLSITGTPITTAGTFAVTLSGTALPIANGGTGQVTAGAAFSALSPITSTGDIIYSSSSTTNSRRAIGSTGNILSVIGGVPAWVANSSFNVLTTTGDLVYSSSGSTASRLAIGTTQQTLNVSAGLPSWGAAPTNSNIYATKTSGTVRTSTTQTADPDLQCTLGVGRWGITIVAFAYCAGTGSLGFQCSVSHSGTYTNATSALVYGSSNGGTNAMIPFGTNIYAGTTISNNNTNLSFLKITSTIIVSVSGTFAFNWAQLNTGSLGATVNAGSFMIATKLA